MSRAKKPGPVWVLKDHSFSWFYLSRQHGWLQLATFMHWPDRFRARRFPTKEDAEAHAVGLLLAGELTSDARVKAIKAFGVLLP